MKKTLKKQSLERRRRIKLLKCVVGRRLGAALALNGPYN